MSKQWHVQQSTAEQLYEQTPDETVQLIWTDPPFGTDQLQVGSEHSYRDGTVADTLALIDQLGASAARILNPSGVLAVCLDYRAVHEAHGILSRYLEPQGEIIWHFELGGVARKWWTNKHNTILLFSRGDDPQFDLDAVPTTLRRVKRGEYQDSTRRVNSVWNYTMGPGSKERVRRANQKPLSIVSPFVSVHTRPGDIILDPFMGSGTTGVAATKLGRRFIGADIDAAAVEITTRRLEGVEHDDEV